MCPHRIYSLLWITHKVHAFYQILLQRLSVKPVKVQGKGLVVAIFGDLVLVSSMTHFRFFVSLTSARQWLDAWRWSEQAALG